jgi:hypothetical protein
MFVNFFFVYVHTTNNATLKKLILTANAWPIEEPFQPSSEIEGEACYFYPPGGGQIFTGRFAIDCFDNYVVTTTCTPISCNEY